MKKIDKKYFEQSKDFDVKQTLSADEEILWEGKPNKKAYIFNSLIGLAIFAVFWLFFDLAFIVVLTTMIKLPSWSWGLLIPFFLLHLAPVWMFVVNAFTVSKRYKNIKYICTDRRIVVQTGFIGLDFKFIIYSEIEGVKCQVSWIDKLLGVGDIYIRAKGNNFVFQDVDNPYELYSVLQTVVADIKTDMMFPNDLRPTSNSGYKTKYKRNNTANKK